MWRIPWCACATGSARTSLRASTNCTTLPVVLELLTSRGEYADHAHGDATLGLPSWHSIHGPILGYGREDASPLQRWCVDHSVIPLLENLLSAELPATPLHGVKFL